MGPLLPHSEAEPEGKRLQQVEGAYLRKVKELAHKESQIQALLHMIDRLTTAEQTPPE